MAGFASKARKKRAAFLEWQSTSVAAMDKMHFYVYQTDANMSYYLIKAVFDSGRCTHDETLRLMNACSQDVDEANNGDDNNNEEDDKKSSVEDDSDKEISSNDEESGEDGSDEDGDSSAAFTRDAIGAGGGQLRHVPSTCFLYTFCLCKLIFSCHVRSSALLSEFAGDQMDHVAMIFWIKRQDKLIHDYSLTGYLLSSNPTNMAHTYENRLTMHNDAVCISLTS